MQKKSFLLVFIFALSFLLPGNIRSEETQETTEKKVQYAPGYEREESFYDYYYGRDEKSEEPASKDSKDGKQKSENTGQEIEN